MSRRDSMPVRCRCGQEFPRHPAYDVQCPACHAAIGDSCKRPSGHNVWRADDGFCFHDVRRSLAFQEIPCQCLIEWIKENPEAEAEFQRLLSGQPATTEQGVLAL